MARVGNGSAGDGRPLVRLAELTMAPNAPANASPGDIDTGEFLDRVRMLSAQGFHVLVSEYFRAFRVRQFLARYTRGAVAFVTDTGVFADVVREDYYDGLTGGMLEALGQLFTPPATVYVHAPIGGADGGSLDAVEIAEPLRPLLAYLRGRGLVEALEVADAAVMRQDRAQVLDDLRNGRKGWREAVPEAARAAIEAGGLLGFGTT